MGFFDSFRKRSEDPAPEAVEPTVEPRTAPWIRVPDADPVPETPSQPSRTPPAFEEAEPFTEAPPEAPAPEEPPEAFKIEPPAESAPAPGPAAPVQTPEPPKAKSAEPSGLGRFFGKKEKKETPAAAAPKRPARTTPEKPAVILNPTERPEPKASTEAELLARKRTRHRLIGAAAILMAAVIAAPFVLDDEESYEGDPTDTTIPPVTVESAPLSIPDQPTKEKETAPAPEKAAEAPAPAPAQKAQAKAPETKTAEKTAAKPAPKAAEKPQARAQAAQPKKAAVPSNGIKPPAGSGFYVQVLATSSELSAEKTVRKLAALGLPAYRVALQQTAATMWRVRVGLYGTRKEAEGVMGTIVLNGIASQPIVGKQ